jgi:hypothetical protein
MSSLSVIFICKNCGKQFTDLEFIGDDKPSIVIPICECVPAFNMTGDYQGAKSDIEIERGIIAENLDLSEQ